MKIVGITRVRNEENIILNTLRHVSDFVDEIYVYDDCSTDNTVDICRSYNKVKKVIEGKVWGTTSIQRRAAEGELRDIVYRESLSSNPDYIYYFDADEYVYPENLDFKFDAYSFRLYDFYITKDDIDKNYMEREFMGPEYRDIIMMFRPNENVIFKDRQPAGISKKIGFGGYVKHYGKSISTEEWESTCDYYINTFGGHYRNRWLPRKGKSVHTMSSFGNDFIKWEDRHSRGIRLTKEIEKNSIY